MLSERCLLVQMILTVLLLVLALNPPTGQVQCSPTKRPIGSSTKSTGESSTPVFKKVCSLSQIEKVEKRKVCGLTEDPKDCPMDDSALEVCCNCFSLCCSLLGESEEEKVEGSSSSSTIIFPGDSLPNSTLSSSGDEASSEEEHVEIGNHGNGSTTQPGGESKSKLKRTTFTRGPLPAMLSVSKETVVNVEEENVSDEIRPQDEPTDELTVVKEAVKIAVSQVKEAMNKLGSALKGDIDDSQEEELVLPLPACSPKRKVNCKEYDILDEFFPPRANPTSTNTKSGRKRRSSITGNTRIPFEKLEVVELQEDEDSTAGGIVAIGTVQKEEESTDTATDTSSSDDISTTDVAVGAEETQENDRQTQTGTTGNMSGDAKPRRKNNAPRNEKSVPVHPDPEEDASQSRNKPELANVTPIRSKEKPGRCQSPTGNKSCVSLGPDSSQCTKDGECPGNKKCCFYACPPYTRVGICVLPAFY